MIWLIGGTSESVTIAKIISRSHLPLIISVTKDNARNLYSFLDSANIFVGKLNPETMVNFIQQYHINTIVDCSHPFATQISQSVILLFVSSFIYLT